MPTFKHHFPKQLSFLVILILSLVVIRNAFAWKPVTHVYLATEVLNDALSDGKVTIYQANYEDQEIMDVIGEYEVDEKILNILKSDKISFITGNFGPDAYPDVATGGMVIHADLKEGTGPKGSVTNDWLVYLWEEGFKGNGNSSVQAWTLGFLCHAAGDMFIHSFLNHFVGGDFNIGDNAVRHIVLEGYIAKRQPGPTVYDVAMNSAISDFMYRKMIYAAPGSKLDTFLLKPGAVCFYLPGRYFSTLRNELAKEVKTSLPGMKQYKEAWIDHIDEGLKAMPMLSHNIAETLFFKKDSHVSGERRSKVKQLLADYAAKHLIWMRGVPTVVGDAAEGISDAAEGISDAAQTLSSLAEVFPGIFTSIPGVVFDAVSGAVSDTVSQAVREEIDGYVDYMIDEMFLMREGMTYDQYRKYLSDPEIYFDEILARPPQSNMEVGTELLVKGSIQYFTNKAVDIGLGDYEDFDLFRDIPAAYYKKVVNTSARPIRLGEANKILKLKDEGYGNPSERWDWRKFAPAFNTTQMVKLMLLDKKEIERFLKDLEKLTKVKSHSAKLEKENAMLGFIDSIDSSSKWKKSHTGKMFLAKEDKFWVQVFMTQYGEEPKLKPFVVHKPIAPGLVISKIDIAPRFLGDADFSKFEPREFRKWFQENEKERVREIVEPRTPQGGGSRAGAALTIADYYFERHLLNEEERKTYKEKDQLVINIEYLTWNLPDDERVEVEVIARVENAGLEAVPYKKTIKYDWEKDYISGKAKIALDIKAPETPNENGETLSLEVLINQQRAFVGVLDGAFIVEAKDEEAEAEALSDELRELSDLRARAFQLASEICSDCASASAAMASIAQQAIDAELGLAELEDKIKEALKILRNLDSMKSELEGAHGKAEALATKIGDAAVFAGERKEAVCQAAEEMSQCETNGKRDQLYSQALSANAEIKPAFTAARGEYKDLEAMGNSALENLDELNKAKDIASEIAGIPDDLMAVNADVASSMERAEALVLGAQNKLVELRTVESAARDLSKEIKKKIKPIIKTPEGKSILQEMNSILGEISAQVKSAIGCLNGPKKEQKAAQRQADKLNQRFIKMKDNIEKIHRAFLPDSEGDLPEIFGMALEKANLIDLLSSMGRGYVERCTEHMLLAKVCMNEADRLSVIDFSAFMPSIIGQKCGDGAGAVGSNNIEYVVVSAGKAQHPDWEFRVESTVPEGGTEVTLAETKAIISCYEELDIPAYLATIDCRPVPGSTAVFDYGQRLGVCDCINGVIFNPSRTRCINCNEYYQGFIGAFEAGNLDDAQAWINEGRACPWAPGAQGQLNSEKQRRACIAIAADLQAACQTNNAALAQGALGAANQWRCNIHPGLIQCANNVINAYNEWVRQQQAQRHQQQQQQMQGFMNAMNDMANQMNNNRNQNIYTPPSGGTKSPSQNLPMPDVGGYIWGEPPKGDSGNTGGSTGGSKPPVKTPGGGGGDPCAGCSGICLLGVCQD